MTNRMTSMVTRLAAVAAPTLALGVAAGLTAAPAEATPSQCYAYVADNGGYARCNAGTGQVRVLLVCGNSTAQHAQYGPWVDMNRNSIVFCDPGYVGLAASCQKGELIPSARA